MSGRPSLQSPWPEVGFQQLRDSPRLSFLHVAPISHRLRGEGGKSGRDGEAHCSEETEASVDKRKDGKLINYAQSVSSEIPQAAS